MMSPRIPSPRIATLCLPALLVGTTAFAQDMSNPTERQKLIDSSPTSFDQFGRSVDTDGTRIVVGIDADDDLIGDGGTAMVYALDSCWREEQRLLPSTPVLAANFGRAVAIDGDVCAVGAPNEDLTGPSSDEGAVYVFRFDGTTWVEEQKLTPAAAHLNEQFGCDLDLQGDVLLIGAFGKYNADGAAYVYRHNGTSWVEEKQLRPNPENSSANFGFDVALDGTVALIGAPQDQNIFGAAYFFRWDGTDWNPDGKVVPLGIGYFEKYGHQVTIDGDRAAVSAYAHGNPGSSAGAVWTYEYDGSVWQETDFVQGANTTNGDNFGYAVVIEGDHLLVGAPRTDNFANTAGSIYTFEFDGTEWVEQNEINPHDATTFQLFGNDLALEDGVLVVGNFRDDEIASNTGAAYVYEGPSLNVGLMASPASVAAGDTLTFDSDCGAPGGLVLLYIVDVSGTPFFVRLLNGNYDSGGEWQFSGPVPGGLSGLTTSFMVFGIAVDNTVGASPVRTVSYL